MILEASHLIFRSSTSKRRVAFGGIVQWSQGTSCQWQYSPKSPSQECAHIKLLLPALAPFPGLPTTCSFCILQVDSGKEICTTLHRKYACCLLLSATRSQAFSPSCFWLLAVFAYYKRSKTGRWDSLAIRLISADVTCTITTRDVASNEAEKPVASSTLLCKNAHTHWWCPINN